MKPKVWPPVYYAYFYQIKVGSSFKWQPPDHDEAIFCKLEQPGVKGKKQANVVSTRRFNEITPAPDDLVQVMSTDNLKNLKKEHQDHDYITGMVKAKTD